MCDEGALRVLVMLALGALFILLRYLWRRLHPPAPSELVNRRWLGWRDELRRMGELSCEVRMTSASSQYMLAFQQERAVGGWVGNLRIYVLPTKLEDDPLLLTAPYPFKVIESVASLYPNLYIAVQKNHAEAVKVRLTQAEAALQRMEATEADPALQWARFMQYGRIERFFQRALPPDEEGPDV